MKNHDNQNKQPKPKQPRHQNNPNKTNHVSPGNTLGRGTEITLYLKDDAEEFLGDSKITEVVQKYSQFINCPILLKGIKSVSKEVPIEESEEVDTEETPKEEGEDDIEVSEEEDEEAPEAPKTKTVTEEVVEWKRLNDFKAIWTRSPKEVTDEEYAEFYKSLDKKPEGAQSPGAKTLAETCFAKSTRKG